MVSSNPVFTGSITKKKAQLLMTLMVFACSTTSQITASFRYCAG